MVKSMLFTIRFHLLHAPRFGFSAFSYPTFNPNLVLATVVLPCPSGRWENFAKTVEKKNGRKVQKSPKCLVTFRRAVIMELDWEKPNRQTLNL